MEYKELVQSAIASLKSNILRTALTMLGIIIGITAVILIVSIGQGAVAFITGELTAFGTNVFSINPGADFSSNFTGVNTLTRGDVEAIEEDTSFTNIESVAVLTSTSEIVTANGEEDRITIQGTTPNGFQVINPDLVAGEYFTEEQEEAGERVAVIGIDAAETFFGEGTEPIGESIEIDNKSFRIVGVIESTSALAGGLLNNSLYIPFTVATDQLIGEEKIQEIDVLVKDPEQMNQTIEDVKVLLRDRHEIEEGDEDDFQIQSFQDVLSTVQNITNMLTLMIAGISAISLVVGGVGVMNIMLVSVTERTKEIGLLKAIGAKNKDILTQFLIEAVIMTLSGGVVGIILGISGAFLISLVVGVPFVISIPAIFMAVGVSTLVGIIFGLYPARRAARLSPIDALRYE